MFQDPTRLTGQSVRLEPLESQHFDDLMLIAQESPEDFTYTSTPINEAQKQSYFAYALETRDRGSAYPWVMIDQKTNQVSGTTRLYDANWNYKNCLLGYTWFSKRLFGTAVNVESKYLILKHAFEDLGLMRVQMNTDSRNARSQQAIKALGAVYEGTLRSSQINKDGYVRDSVIYSVIDKDWQKVKAHLEQRLAAKLSKAII